MKVTTTELKTKSHHEIQLYHNFCKNKFFILSCVSLRNISYQSNLFHFSLSHNTLVGGTGSIDRSVLREYPYCRRFRFIKNKISLSYRIKIISLQAGRRACVIKIFLRSYWHVLFVTRLMAHILIYICVYTQAHLSIPRLDYTYSITSILYMKQKSINIL